jgi:tetratricopeptide (TPR) repeat protein
LERKELAVDVGETMKKIPQELKIILDRSLWLYLAVLVIFVGSLDYKQAAKERGRYLLGIFYNEQLQNFEDGIVYFDYLIRHKPKDAHSHFLLGYCYAQLKDYENALKYFKDAVRLNPSESSYPAYLEFARAKVADPQTQATLPAGEISIPID